MEIISALELEIAKRDARTKNGITTNHMHAVWGARDAINELLMVSEEATA